MPVLYTCLRAMPFLGSCANSGWLVGIRVVLFRLARQLNIDTLPI